METTSAAIPNAAIPSTPEITESPTLPLSPRPKCLVCGDNKQVFKNYEALTCYGCKSFFRRSINAKKLYTCKRNQNCAIEKGSRNACRYCRLKKCRDIGMQEANIRDGRNNKPRSPTKQPSLPPFSPQAGTSGVSASKMSDTSRELIHFLTSMTTVCTNMSDPRYDDLNDDDWQDLEKQFDRSLSLSEGLQDPARVCPRWRLNFASSRPAQTHDIAIAWYRVFVYMADWANAIPQFRALSLADREKLFRKNFVKLSGLYFGCTARGKYKTGKTADSVPFGNGAYVPIDSSEYLFTGFLSKISELFEQLINEPLYDIDIDETEFLLFQGICLFDFREELSMEGQEIAEGFFDQLSDALLEYQDERFPTQTPKERNRRYTQFLMIMGRLMEVWNTQRDLYFSLSTFNLINLDGIPNELLCFK